MTSFEEIVQGLDEKLMEPTLNSGCQEVISSAQEMSIRQFADRDEIRQEVRKLNAKWKEALRSQDVVAVSGEIFTGISYVEGDHEFVMLENGETTALTNYPIRSAGFAVVDGDHMTEGNQGIFGARVLFIGNIVVDSNDEDEDEDDFDIFCAIEVDHIDPIYENFSRSFEDTRHLAETHKTQFELLRNVIISSETLEDALMSLKVCDRIYTGEPTEEVEVYREFANKFLDNNLELDDTMPYLATIQGKVGLYDETRLEHDPKEFTEPARVFIAKPNIAYVFDNKDITMCELVFQGVVVSDIIDRDQHIRIPINCLQSIQSTRSFYKDYL